MSGLVGFIVTLVVVAAGIGALLHWDLSARIIELRAILGAVALTAAVALLVGWALLVYLLVTDWDWGDAGPLAGGGLGYGLWWTGWLVVRHRRRTPPPGSVRVLGVVLGVVIAAGVAGAAIALANASSCDAGGVLRGDVRTGTAGMVLDSGPALLAVPLLYGMRRSLFALLVAAAAVVLLGVDLRVAPPFFGCGFF